jgi:hypothetical protein
MYSTSLHEENDGISAMFPSSGFRSPNSHAQEEYLCRATYLLALDATVRGSLTPHGHCWQIRRVTNKW